ncbi:MAG: prenyltransferase [Myxococcales bacterium]|jgi:1,4-dihydroxy-2-naphthoate octaprenyltransferase
MSQANALAGYAGVARAPFLLLPVTLVANGAAAQAYAGGFSWLHTILAAIGLVAAHAAVNVKNEVVDFETGLDLATVRTPFSGGSGTLPAGVLSVGKAKGFFWFNLLVAALVAVALVAQVGWPLVPIIAAGLFFTVCYSPYLTRSGTGEIAAGLGLGLLPVLGAAVAQDGAVTSVAIAAGVPGFFMTFNLLLLNEFPDEGADRAGGRRNLVLLLGRRGAARVYLLAAGLCALSIAASVALGLLPWTCLVAMAPALALVPAIRWALGDTAAAVPLPALAGNVMWNLGTNALLAAGFVAARWL